MSHKNIHSNNVLNCCKSFDTIASIAGSVSSVASMKRLNNLSAPSSGLSFLCKCSVRLPKRHNLSLYGCSVLSLNVRQLTARTFFSGAGKTSSLQHFGIFFQKCCNYSNFGQLVEISLSVCLLFCARVSDICEI